MPGSLNLTGTRAIVAYTTFTITIDMVDAAGDPIDLSPFDPVTNALAQGMRAMFRQTIASADPPLFDCKDPSVAGAVFPGTGVTITQPATLGRVVLTISAAETGLKTQGATPAIPSGVWDMVGVGKITVAKDYILALVEGNFDVNTQVTRGI